MINIVKLPGVDRRKHTITDVIEEFGPWRVLIAALREIVRRGKSRAVIRSSALSSHLRKDVGLPPEPMESHYWDLG